MQSTHTPLRQRKWFLPVILLLALLVLGECILFTLVVINSSRLDAPIPADTMVVLGAHIREDGTPTPMLERRLNRAAELYHAAYAPSIIVCGAQGDDEPMTEAIAMQNYLITQGIPADAIHLEDASYNTMESLENAKAIMEGQGYASAIIVSSDYHLWRALSMCAHIGLPATSGAGAQNALTLRQAILNCLQETASWVKYVLTR